MKSALVSVVMTPLLLAGCDWGDTAVIERSAVVESCESPLAAMRDALGPERGKTLISVESEVAKTCSNALTIEHRPTIHSIDLAQGFAFWDQASCKIHVGVVFTPEGCGRGNLCDKAVAGPREKLNALILEVSKSTLKIPADQFKDERTLMPTKSYVQEHCSVRK